MRPTEKEGGAAFPWANDANKEYYWINHGMSLRDWFAGMALQGIAGNTATCEAQEMAQCCYAFADAMLAARKETR